MQATMLVKAEPLIVLVYPISLGRILIACAAESGK
jgi:hypothetical protein